MAAILRDNLPVDGFASSPDRLGKWLADAGYGVAYLTGSQMANRFVLRGPRGAGEGDPPPINLLVLPYGGTFPAAANRSLQNFLRHGGAFLSTGGYAFDTLLVQYDGKWYKPKDLPPPTTPILPLMDFNTGDLDLAARGIAQRLGSWLRPRRALPPQLALCRAGREQVGRWSSRRTRCGPGPRPPSRCPTSCPRRRRRTGNPGP